MPPSLESQLPVGVRRQARADSPRQARGRGAPREEDVQGQEGDLRVHREGRPGQDTFSGVALFDLIQDELGLLEDEFDDLKDVFKVL